MLRHLRRLWAHPDHAIVSKWTEEFLERDARRLIANTRHDSVGPLKNFQRFSEPKILRTTGKREFSVAKFFFKLGTGANWHLRRDKNDRFGPEFRQTTLNLGDYGCDIRNIVLIHRSVETNPKNVGLLQRISFLCRE